MRCTVREEYFEKLRKSAKSSTWVESYGQHENNRKVQFLGRLMILLKSNVCSGTLFSICLLGGAFYSYYQIATN